MGPLFFNGSWTMFCRVWIVRTYILMILLLVPPVRRRRRYWLTTTATCVLCWIGYEKKSRLLRLAKPISLFVRLRFVAMCWKMAHVGRRQGKCWRLELRGFLGLANYYSGYVQNYASIATPLINMLKDLPKHKNGKKIGLTWNASANEAFLKLKRAITDIVPLQLADWDKDFVLPPDASNWAVGAALEQEGPDGALRPLAFFSRKL